MDRTVHTEPRSLDEEKKHTFVCAGHVALTCVAPCVWITVPEVAPGIMRVPLTPEGLQPKTSTAHGVFLKWCTEDLVSRVSHGFLTRHNEDVVSPGR